jgi:hypothetical protein
MCKWVGLLSIGGLLVAGLPSTAAQDAPPSPGICDGAICGPSGAFTVREFPTTALIAWDAFPPNPARPYTPSGGRTIHVAPGGDDANDGTAGAPLASPRRALELAQSGDVILVANGTYPLGPTDEYEGLVMDTPGVTLAAETIGGAILEPAGADLPAVAINARADKLVIDGFVIRGFRSAGIYFGRGESPQGMLVLKHLLIEDTAEGILATYDGDGVQPVIEGLLVYDVWLRDIGLIGLQCGQGPCNDMRWEALRVEMPSTSSDSGADAIAVESGANIVVFNVEVSGASGDGIDIKGARVAVANVIVHDVTRNGIKLWAGGDVINALVYNTGADAAVVFEAGDYRLLNCTVARHAWGQRAYAMTVSYDTPTAPGSLAIINSAFYQNAGAIWVSPAFDLTVRNSIFFGSTNGEELIWDPLTIGAAASPISALEAAGGGRDNPGLVDPLFADPDAGDYTWPTNSPLRDAGTDAIDTLPAFDLLGNPRRVGAGVDLGPWERE